MNKVLSFLLKFLVAVTLGLAITGFVMQRDPHLLATIERKIHTIFGATFCCVSSGKITSINLVWPTIEMESFVVKDEREPSTWHWSCRRAKITFSWISVILNRAFPLKIELFDVRSQSSMKQGIPAIAEHLQRLSTPVPGGLPIFAKELHLQQVIANLQDTEHPITVILHGTARMRKMRKGVRWNVVTSDGQLWWNQKTYVSDIQGSVLLDVGKPPRCDCTLTCKLPCMKQVGKQSCFIHTTCDNYHATASLNSGDRSLQIQAAGDIRNLPGTVRADVAIKDFAWQGIQLPAVQFTLSADEQKKKLTTGIVDLQLSSELALTGSWTWDDAKGISLSVANQNIIHLLEPWIVAPHTMTVDAMINRSGDVEGTFGLVTSNTETSLEHTSKGSFSRAGTQLGLQGKLNAAPFALYTTATNQFRTTIDYGCIRSLMPPQLAQDLIGQGTLVCDVSQQTDKVFSGSLYLKDGTIKVSQISNYLNELKARIDLDFGRRTCVVSDGKVGFHRGTVSIPRATFFWDDQYRFTSIYMPIIAQEVFASWQKEFITAIAGQLLVQKKPNKRMGISGTLFLDHANMKGVTVSTQQKTPRLAGVEPIDLDVRILTRNGLTMSMPELDARADIDLSVKQTTADPLLAGHIKFVSGSIKFPYKPLNIVSGMISYLPGQDPAIEIVAKNRIRTYNITLRVQGTLGMPQVMVESSPALTQEQIITLLLAGTEQGSLNLLMPTLVVQNLQEALFQKSKSPWNSYFKKLLRPLSRVRLVPSFIDETGRGGLRGAIEIEVSDELSAVIEKNFSLPEDTKIKIDYAISDDVSIRGIRDERGDFGSEVEFRWHR